MANLLSIPLEAEEIVSFLKRNFRLKEVYQEIIHQRIVNQSAQERGLTITSTEMQNEINRIFRARHFEQRSDVLAWLSDQMMTWSDLEMQIHERLLTDKLARELFSDEVQEFFSQHQSEFDQVLLYKIAVPYESLAQEIFYQIIEEEISFYEAAHLYNMDERGRSHCGYMGKQLRRMLDSEVAELLFSASIGEVIGPLKSPGETYELFLVDDFFSSELTSEVYEDLLNQRLKDWLGNEVDLYVAAFNADRNTELQ